MNRSIEHETLEQFRADFAAERTNRVAMNAVTSSGLNAAARRWQGAEGPVHQYSLRLPHKGITNQKASGRCWMFAALNFLRFQIIQKLELESFELSQNYVCFYDKLEKANYFYENILSNLDLCDGSRELDFLLQGPVQDGGQWDMVAALFRKYGVAPKDAMPETACSSSTREMNTILTGKLRADAAALRRDYRAGTPLAELRARKAQKMEEVYRILCICLGTPPERFDFKVRTKSDKYIADCGLTPHEFYDKYIGLDLGKYISLINAPTDDKPFLRSYTVKFLGNVAEAPAVRYVNVPAEVMKKAAIAQMRDGLPVWFGCDVGKMSNREAGAMDLGLYDYESLLGQDLSMTKGDRLTYGHSAMTHAMTFQGVDLTDGDRPVRWCVENSWGDEPGKKGMYLMTDEWFDQYLYQVVVDRRYLPDDVLAAYDAEPIVLQPWDPMGALA